MPQALPTSARERVDAADPRGRIEAIQVRPGRRDAVRAVETWDPSSDADHGTASRRAVTLLQREHLAVVAALLGRPVEFAQTRRNVLVSGFNLEVAVGRPLRIGGVVLELTQRCHPCRRMEEALGRGGFAAMYGHGGWCARILTGGVLQVGDEVRLGDPSQLPLW